VIKV